MTPYALHPRHASGAALALALTCAWWPVQAQNPTPATTAGDIAHTVSPGDTLEALARHYLDDAQQWHALAQANHIANPRHLQPGSTVRIPYALLPYAPASVQFVQGSVQATLPDGTAAPHLVAAQQLPEGTRLQVPHEGFVSIRLQDGSIIRVQADSDLQLQRLRKQPRPGTAQSVIELQRGSVEPSVTPAKDGARRLDIRTPKATASVRGTHFSVRATQDGRTLTAVTHGSVAVQGSTQGSKPTLLALGQGVVTSADGSVGSPVPLLAAPDLSALPTTVHDADFLRLSLPQVAGASVWQVQIARDADLTEVVRATDSPSANVTLPAVEDGRYRVAVRLLDAQGLPGFTAEHELTVKAHPIAPLYQQPGKDATVEASLLHLECTRVSEAQRYRIQAATDATFAHPLLDTTSTGTCGAEAPSLKPGHYVWRIASLRQLPDGTWDQGPYAAPQGFSVAPPALAANALKTAQTASDGTTLSWPAQPGQSFRLQVARSADFKQLLTDAPLTSPSWSAAGLGAGHYYVRIRTIDPSGLQSAFSAPYLLHVVSRVDSGSGQAITTGDGTPLQRP